MPRPDSVSSKTVIDKKRNHLVNQTKTEGVTEKEDIQKPNIICGNVEAGNAWEVFLEEAGQEAERCGQPFDCERERRQLRNKLSMHGIHFFGAAPRPLLYRFLHMAAEIP